MGEQIAVQDLFENQWTTLVILEVAQLDDCKDVRKKKYFHNTAVKNLVLLQNDNYETFLGNIYRSFS